MDTALTDSRQRRLHHLPLVFGIVVAAGAILLWGELNSPVPYSHPDFVIGYFSTELLTAAFLLAVTLALFPARTLGWRAPVRSPLALILPSILLVLAVVGAWLAAVRLLPAGTAYDPMRPLLVLRTTALVGINEEWLFRGFVLTALCARLGLRKGAVLAALAFGAFHAMNLAAGQSIQMVLLQVGSTTLMGSVLALAAIGTRSLLWPIVAHALYDLSVLELGRLLTLGAPPMLVALVTVTGWLLGLVSFVMLFRLTVPLQYDDA